jgi:hypothetical protein
MLDAVRDPWLAHRIASVHNVNGEWAYVLHGGLELQVGERFDLALKFAVAQRILERTAVTGYLDVSLPKHPVAAANPQLSG